MTISQEVWIHIILFWKTATCHLGCNWKVGNFAHHVWHQLESPGKFLRPRGTIKICGFFLLFIKINKQMANPLLPIRVLKYWDKKCKIHWKGRLDEQQYFKSALNCATMTIVHDYVWIVIHASQMTMIWIWQNQVFLMFLSNLGVLMLP